MAKMPTIRTETAQTTRVTVQPVVALAVEATAMMTMATETASAPVDPTQTTMMKKTTVTKSKMEMTAKTNHKPRKIQ